MTYLEFARRSRRWSQAQLAQLTDIDQKFISMIETGRGNPDPSQLQRIARALDLSPELVLKPVVVVGAAATTEGGK